MDISGGFKTLKEGFNLDKFRSYILSSLVVVITYKVITLFIVPLPYINLAKLFFYVLALVIIYNLIMEKRKKKLEGKLNEPIPGNNLY